MLWDSHTGLCWTWKNISPCIWNLERWYWWTYLQGSNGDADIENRLVDTAGEEELWHLHNPHTCSCSRKSKKGHCPWFKVMLLSNSLLHIPFTQKVHQIKAHLLCPHNTLHMSFCGLITHLFLSLNNIPFSGWKPEFLSSSTSWKASCLLPGFGNYE